jgi:hypothetical protein
VYEIVVGVVVVVEKELFSRLTMSVNAKSKSVFNIHNITIIYVVILLLLFILHVDDVVVFIVVKVRKTHGKETARQVFRHPKII